MCIVRVDSPVRTPTLMSADDVTLSGLWIGGQKYGRVLLREETVRERETDNLAIFRETARWLKLYLSGQEPNFHPQFSFSGSKFRKEIAREMLLVPYRCTASYRQLAESLTARQGKSCVSPHAIGSTVAHNPLLILIPRHRVINADGHLTGYADGSEQGEYLLTPGAGQLWERNAAP